MEYKAIQDVLENKHIYIRFRFKLFDAIISSTVLYALESCPLTEKVESRLDVMQRKILRRMVGWVCNTGESWEVVGHRMKHRLQRCLGIYPIMDWSKTIVSRKLKVVSAIAIFYFKRI